MNKKTIIVGSAVALGLTGLAWLVTENEIRALQNRALNRELRAMTAQNSSIKEELQQQSLKFMRLADIGDQIQKLNPWTYVVPYFTRLYYNYMHMVRRYDPIKKY